MAQVKIYSRVANPAKKRANKKRAKSKSKHHRKTTHHAKAHHKRNASPKKRVNSVKRAANRHTTVKRRHKHNKRITNPAPIAVVMGATNPKRKSNKKRSNPTVTKRKTNPHRTHNKKRHHKRGHNPVVRANKKRNTSRKRNPPMVFGQSAASGNVLKMILGGLVGVAATKIAVAALPAQMLSNTIIRVVATGALAFVLGMLAAKSGIGQAFADGVTFGGLMQAGSTALALVPGGFGTQLALNGGRGMADLVPAKFALPENPVKQAARQLAASTAATMTAAAPRVGGLSVLRPAFGR